MNKRIGIALSGGGIRATIFHLGVLKQIAEQNELEAIKYISSVSGGSLCVGLIYSYNKLAWPTSKQYISSVLPYIRQVLLSTNIQTNAIFKLICSPWNFSKKVNLLAQVLSDKWGIHGDICDLSEDPEWCINCTTYETGKRFKIMPKLMGDYKIGYVENPSFPIADAISASAGFPLLVGPYKLNHKQFSWQKSKYEKKEELVIPDKYLHLWDGGVYDNLGLESIFKITGDGQLEPDVNYILISNASSDIGYEKRKIGITKRGVMRLLNITMDQVVALRMRSAMNMIQREKNGTIFKIGNDTAHILRKSVLPEDTKKELIGTSLSASEVKMISQYPTTLFKPTEKDFDLLLRHGYEVAKYTILLARELETTKNTK